MDIAYIIIVLGVILVSMTVHEAMHGFMAYWLGDDTAKLQGRLTLNPIKHIDPFLTILLPVSLALINLVTGVYTPIFGGAKPVPFNPNTVRFGEWGAALVAFAGPATNLIIAFIAFMILAFVDPAAAQMATLLQINLDASILSEILMQFVFINLGFFAFNMLPVPPLDGSRVLYALAPDFFRRWMEVIEQYGLFVVFALVMLGGGLIGVIMGSTISVILKVFSGIAGI